MIWRRVSSFHRSLLAIGLALALPTALVIALQISFAFKQQQHDTEMAALARAEQVSMLNDARIETDLAAMRVLAGSPNLLIENWEPIVRRVRQVMPLNPGWKDVIVTDRDTGLTLFDLSGAPGAVSRTASIQFNNRGVGGVERTGPGCPCVYLRTPVIGETRRPMILTVVVDPAMYQGIIAPRAPAGSISATVDRDGDFVARSQMFTERVGMPATRYVQDALHKGGAGLYEGVTYEGLKNVTAYYTSPFSGWSVHIAVKASLLKSPRVWSNWALVIGGLIGIMVAGVSINLILSNLAESRREDERRRQAQKLEALGRLTGGVAHDFNNLLTVIIGGLGMLMIKVEDPRARRWAESSLEAANRAAKLTRQLLAFSKGQGVEIRPVNLVALLDTMRDLLRQSLGPDTVLEYDLDPVSYWVLSDESQLETAILNLCINARDAMPEGGTLSITATPTAKDNMIDIIVADTGVGMTPDVLERAMEPFFTTKTAGSGTGLGLAQVFGAVQQSGGAVRIDSQPGRGTQVRMTLPAAEPPPEPEAAPVRTLHAAPSPSRSRVLVVDDEPGVRDIIAETLRSAGYGVSEAPDPATALRLVGADSINLLLTDFAMPGMNGTELARRALDLDPDLRVLIVSGHADIEAVAAIKADAPLLQKPFSADELLAAVEKALASPAHEAADS